MGTVREFLWAIASDWLALMSGIASLSLALIVGLHGADHPWLWWMAAYVCALLAAFRVWKSEWRKPGPQLIVEYETANTIQPEGMVFREYCDWRNSGGGKETDIPIILRNLSDVVAINVKINDISLAGNVAKFPIVPKVLKDEPVRVSATIDGFGAMQRYDLTEFLKAGWQSLEDLLVPITVSCTDVYGKQFETLCEIRYSRWVVTTHLKKYRRIGIRPRWFARRHTQ